MGIIRYIDNDEERHDYLTERLALNSFNEKVEQLPENLSVFLSAAMRNRLLDKLKVLR